MANDSVVKIVVYWQRGKKGVSTQSTVKNGGMLKSLGAAKASVTAGLLGRLTRRGGPWTLWRGASDRAPQGARCPPWWTTVGRGGASRCGAGPWGGWAAQRARWTAVGTHCESRVSFAPKCRTWVPWGLLEVRIRSTPTSSWRRATGSSRYSTFLLPNHSSRRLRRAAYEASSKHYLENSSPRWMQIAGCAMADVTPQWLLVMNRTMSSTLLTCPCICTIVRL